MSFFDLVIFDCDGTLVDSEILNNLSCSEVLTTLGYPQYTTEYCLEAFVGTSQAKLWEVVIKDTGQPLPADVNQRFIDRVAANMNMAKQAPGIADVLMTLSKTHMTCVGSNGERPNVVGALESTDLMRFFSDDRIFTVEDVVHPKPDPELYLWAAQKMGVSPDRCLVVEDSVLGATAGVAAGMKVFGYTGLAHDQRQQAAKLKNIGVDVVSPDMREVLKFIEQDS